MARRLRAVLIGIAIVVALVGAVVGWRLRSYNRWLVEDTQTLDPFATTLYPAPAAPLDSRDQALTYNAMQGRLAVELTRTSYWHGVMGSDCWVKTCLVTGKPDDREALRRIKLLHHLRLMKSGWEVVRVEELAVP